jgi:hypothetical protein
VKTRSFHRSHDSPVRFRCRDVTVAHQCGSRSSTFEASFPSSFCLRDDLRRKKGVLGNKGSKSRTARTIASILTHSGIRLRTKYTDYVTGAMKLDIVVHPRSGVQSSPQRLQQLEPGGAGRHDASFKIIKEP